MVKEDKKRESYKVVRDIVSKLIKKGKKDYSVRFFNKLLYVMKKRVKVEWPVDVLEESLDRLSPRLGLVLTKVGGVKYRIPVSIKEDGEWKRALDWLNEKVKLSSWKMFFNLLVEELSLAYTGKGELIKKKEALYEEVELNWAYLKYLKRLK